MSLSPARKRDLRRLRNRLEKFNRPVYFQHAINTITQELNDADRSEQEKEDDEKDYQEIIRKRRISGPTQGSTEVL